MPSHLPRMGQKKVVLWGTETSVSNSHLSEHIDGWFAYFGLHSQSVTIGCGLNINRTILFSLNNFPKTVLIMSQNLETTTRIMHIRLDRFLRQRTFLKLDSATFASRSTHVRLLPYLSASPTICNFARFHAKDLKCKTPSEKVPGERFQVNISKRKLSRQPDVSRRSQPVVSQQEIPIDPKRNLPSEVSRAKDSVRKI